jgi:hypothetical protein
MHSAAWVKLLRQVPADEQNKLMVVTAGGTEIAVQCFLRIDHEFLALKVRLAGSQDAGRVFFIPYTRIDYFGFQQEVKESEFHAVFGSLEVPAALDVASASGKGPPAPAAPAAGVPAATGAEAPSVSARTPVPIKSTILEKFRSRSMTSPGTVLRPPRDE